MSGRPAMRTEPLPVTLTPAEVRMLQSFVYHEWRRHLAKERSMTGKFGAAAAASALGDRREVLLQLHGSLGMEPSG